MSTRTKPPVWGRTLGNWMLGGAFWGIPLGGLAGFLSTLVPTLDALPGVSRAEVPGVGMALGCALGALIGVLLVRGLDSRDYRRAMALAEAEGEEP